MFNTKKLLTTIAATSVAALALTSCSIGESNSADGGENIVVSYNTPEEWANWREVLDAFTEKTGIEAPNDPKNSGQTLSALAAEKAAPAADVAYYGIVFGMNAKKDDLITNYKPEGFDEVPENLKDADGNWFTVHQGAVAMLVNTEELGDAEVPECWADLTDPQYKDKVGYLDPTQAAVGYSVLTAANLGMGGDLDNFDPGLKWAEKMAKNGTQTPAQTATSSVQQGEIPILIDADFNGYKLAAEGSPIEVVYPCEGTLSIPYTMSLVKDAPHEDQGKKLLDYVLSDEAQKEFAASFLRPVRDVELPQEAKDAFPSDEEYERLVKDTDFAKMNEVQEKVTGEFEERVHN